MSSGRLRVTPERATFAVTAAILLALAGAITSLWIQGREPASVTVERVGGVRQAQGQSYVTGEVRNVGDETAQAVQVIAELSVGGEVVAEGEQSVDFLSGGETEEIAFIFERTAPQADIELRVASYKVP